MSTAETALVTIAIVLMLLAVGNVVLAIVAERRNPPIGSHDGTLSLNLPDGSRHYKS